MICSRTNLHSGAVPDFQRIRYGQEQFRRFFRFSARSSSEAYLLSNITIRLFSTGRLGTLIIRRSILPDSFQWIPFMPSPSAYSLMLKVSLRSSPFSPKNTYNFPYHICSILLWKSQDRSLPEAHNIRPEPGKFYSFQRFPRGLIQ